MLPQRQPKHYFYLFWLLPARKAKRTCIFQSQILHNSAPLVGRRQGFENRQKHVLFKERFLPLKIILSLSICSHFKVHNLFFLTVLTECKSKLNFCMNYSLQVNSPTTWNMWQGVDSLISVKFIWTTCIPNTSHVIYWSVTVMMTGHFMLPAMR